MPRTEEKYIVALDIGTSKVCVLVGEINDRNQIEIIGKGTSPMKGTRRGNIIKTCLPSWLGRCASTSSMSLVRGPSRARLSSTTSCSLATLSDRADLIARRRIFFGTS